MLRLINRMVCQFLGHDWQLKYKQKKYPDSDTPIDRSLKICLEGLVEIAEKKCGRCGKICK